MPEPHLRAADADREAVATALGRHMAAGRLTLAEYEDRVARAWSARTYGDLAALTTDLPVQRIAARAAAPHDPSAGDSWRAWRTTSVTVLAVYLAIAVGTWELHYFWPVWVIGPWGAVLLAQTLAGGLGRGVDRRRTG